MHVLLQTQAIVQQIVWSLAQREVQISHGGGQLYLTSKVVRPVTNVYEFCTNGRRVDTEFPESGLFIKKR